MPPFEHTETVSLEQKPETRFTRPHERVAFLEHLAQEFSQEMRTGEHPIDGPEGEKIRTIEMSNRTIVSLALGLEKYLEYLHTRNKQIEKELENPSAHINQENHKQEHAENEQLIRMFESNCATTIRPIVDGMRAE